MAKQYPIRWRVFLLRVKLGQSGRRGRAEGRKLTEQDWWIANQVAQRCGKRAWFFVDWM